MPPGTEHESVTRIRRYRVDLDHDQGQRRALRVVRIEDGNILHRSTKIAVLTSAIARSEIVRAPSPGRAPRLPDGFADVDVAILEWIGAKGWAAGLATAPVLFS